MSKDILNIALCDDISAERYKLKSAIDKYMRNADIAYEIVEYISGEELLAVEYSKYDIIFLDIFMDDLNGIEAARRIKAGNENAQIVFCSTSNEFAAESYNVSAFYYITKPVEENVLFSVLDKFVRMYYKAQSIDIKVGRDSESILVTDIIYAEAQGKKTVIHTKSKRIEASVLLSQFEELLPQTGFCKPIRYAVVSMDEIVRIPSDYLELSDGSRVQISRSLRKEIKNKFTQYKLEKTRRRFMK